MLSFGVFTNILSKMSNSLSSITSTVITSKQTEIRILTCFLGKEGIQETHIIETYAQIIFKLTVIFKLKF